VPDDRMINKKRQRIPLNQIGQKNCVFPAT
jgi:hypothetical protein